MRKCFLRLEKALKENYIYVEFDQPIYELIQNSCDIYVIPHVVTSEMVAIAWRKNLPHGILH